MTKAELMQSVRATIDRRGEEIIALGEAIRRQPELGFKETKTARLVEETFANLGLSPKAGLAMTGVRAEARGRGDGPTFALLGELDALVVSGHPEGDPATGAAHACGHNAQIAGLLGAAIALAESGVLAELTGRIALFAVPAEEGGDLEWRESQVRAGTLELLGGKCELLRLGHLDDVDLAMMIHTTPRREDGLACVPRSNNGRFGKMARFVGRAAHAGAAPHLGVNALYAAQIALAGINAHIGHDLLAQREKNVLVKQPHVFLPRSFLLVVHHVGQIPLAHFVHRWPVGEVLRCESRIDTAASDRPV